MKPSKKIVFLLLLLFILLLFISCSLVSRAGVLWRRSELLKTREGYVREYSYYTPPPLTPSYNKRAWAGKVGLGLFETILTFCYFGLE